MILVFMGPSGCGKGTQADYLKNEKGYTHISTGDLLRAEQQAGTELGDKVKDDIANGVLISDEIILTLVKKQLALLPENNILFDGFPRTIEQAKALDLMLLDMKKEIECVIDFSVTEEELYDRIKGRFMCIKCSTLYHDPNYMPKVKGVCDKCQGTEFKTRPDDTVEVLSKRLTWFKELVTPIREYYKQKNVLKTLDASKSILQVRKEIVSFLNN
jgi:adenylate kinase